MEAVVLAGGSGSGLRVITGGKPKVLLNICGEPFIKRVIKNLLQAGVRKTTIISDKPSEFENVTVSLGRDMEFELREQKEPEVVGALKEAADLLSRGKLLIYGDTLVPSEAYLLTVSASVESGYPTLMIVPNEDIKLYGAVRVDNNGFLTEFKEKPHEGIQDAYAFGGVAVLNREIVELIESFNNFERALNEYVKLGGRIKTALWSGTWVDLGYPVNTLEAMYYIMMEGFKGQYISSKAEISENAVIKGPVYIDEGAIVDHYAIIQGPSYIGKNALIGSHTFIRQYSDIEKDVTVGSYSEVVWSLISEKVTVGRGSFLGYSIIGEGAIIEPQVTTKLLVPPSKEGINAIKTVKKRRLYYKSGAVIPARSRVSALSVLEPGTVLSNP